jgi:hypothetical protein
MLKIEVTIYILLVLPCLWLYIQNAYLETTKHKLLLHQQFAEKKLQTQTDQDAKKISTEKEKHLINLYSSFSSKDIDLFGSIFMPSKLSEILLTDPDVLETLNLDRVELDKEVKIGREAITMLSMSTSKQGGFDKDKGASNSKFVSGGIARMKSHGVVVYSHVIEEDLNKMAAAKLLDKTLNDYYLINKQPINVDKNGFKTIVAPCTVDMHLTKVMHSILSPIGPVVEHILGKDSLLVDFYVLNALKVAGKNKAAAMEPGYKCYDVHEEKLYAFPKSYSLMYFPEGIIDEVTNTTFEFIPGTMTYAHFLEDEEKKLLQPLPIVESHISPGSVLLIDNCVFHRVGSFLNNNNNVNINNNNNPLPNDGKKSNPLRVFVMTFTAQTSLPSGIDANPYNGSVIKQEYFNQKITLNDLTTLETPKDILMKFGHHKKKN